MPLETMHANETVPFERRRIGCAATPNHDDEQALQMERTGTTTVVQGCMPLAHLFRHVPSSGYVPSTFVVSSRVILRLVLHETDTSPRASWSRSTCPFPATSDPSSHRDLSRMISMVPSLPSIPLRSWCMTAPNGWVFWVGKGDRTRVKIQ